MVGDTPRKPWPLSTFGVASICTSWPSRSTVSTIWFPPFASIARLSVFQPFTGCPSTATMWSPLLQAGLRGGTARDDRADRGARAFGDAATDDHHEEQQERDEQVHGDTREHDLHAIAVAALPVGAGLVFGIDLFEAAHADDPHVAAERERLHAVLGLSALERPQARPEPEEELGDLHARALRGDVVAGLVEHHHEHDADDDRQRDAAARHEHREPHERGDEHHEEARGASPGHLDGGLLQRILHYCLTRCGRGYPLGARSLVR